MAVPVAVPLPCAGPVLAGTRLCTCDCCVLLPLLATDDDGDHDDDDHAVVMMAMTMVMTMAPCGQRLPPTRYRHRDAVPACSAVVQHRDADCTAGRRGSHTARQ